jgi:carboxyl-terminal processing protease
MTWRFGKHNRRWLLPFLLMAMHLPVAAADPDRLYNKLDIFAQVLQYIQNSYVEDVDTEKLLYGAIRGMLKSLDPHTSFMTPKEFQSMQEDTSGHFGGVGIELEMRNETLVVVSPIDGSPAAIAGILTGDRILKIDGVLIGDIQPGEASNRIKGAPGTKVVLTIDRDSFEQPKDFVLIRQRISTNPITQSMPLPGYGVIRIKSFQERTDRHLGDALREFKSKSGGTLKGLVLDLRNNPGGLLDQAIRVADRFLSEGVIVETKGRGNKTEKDYAHKQGTEPNYPMVCLVNGGSASASEIVAGALQDHGRALVLGTRTFGKGSVQTVITLKDKSGLKMTIARYYTPNHRSIQEQGILPDILVAPESPDTLLETITREEDLVGHFKKEAETVSPQKQLQEISDTQLRTALMYLKAWEKFGSTPSTGEPAPPAPKKP